MEALRVRRFRRLETAVWYYQHSATLRWVTVAGVYPHGEADYYISLRNIIERMRSEGSQVHYERLFVHPPEEEMRIHPDELEVIRQIDQVEVLRIARASVLGWIDVREALRPSDGWQHHDVTAQEVFSHTGSHWARQQARRSIRLLDWPDTNRRGPAKYRLYIATTARLAARHGRTGWVKDHPALTQHRITTAVKAVRDTDNHSVLIWDPDVLPGIATALAGLGFVRQWSEWLRVGQLPHCGATTAQLLLGRAPSTRKASRPTARGSDDWTQ
ncbi:hypothetical protein [Plantactinospora sp. CA-290183]|uniref:hypothetical protein n=1 Tax=Plantactinospora sp. CA-290183 TaxID=3240006 RepID=UPI003D8AA6BA